jgi:hypothetical protein
MPTNKSYSKLEGALTGFNKMIQRFGVVTVMNARIYDVKEASLNGTKKVDEIISDYVADSPIARLDTLKVANVTIDGPDKTVTGGQYNNPLIKFGKTATIEMQDALGNASALEALCGGLIEAFGTDLDSWKEETESNTVALHFDESFAGAKTIIGDSFFIDQKTGQQIPVTIIFYQVLPTSIFNLTQDSEGDATVFDMNGDLLTTNIRVGTDGTTAGNMVHGVFYSIVPGITWKHDDNDTGSFAWDPAGTPEA